MAQPRRPKLNVAVRPLALTKGQTASAQLSIAARSWLGSSARLLDKVPILYRPSHGTATREDRDVSSEDAVRYEMTTPDRFHSGPFGGKAVHGIVYLFVRPDGSAIMLDLFDAGAAQGAEWEYLTGHLVALLAGLSMKES